MKVSTPVILSYAPIPTGITCDLIPMTLTTNNFTYIENHCLQIHGTAMGTQKMAPSFINLFLGLFVSKALGNVSFKPRTWLRYLNDIFMIRIKGHGKLKIFINYLNGLHPHHQIHQSYSSTNVPFFDVNVLLTDDGNIHTDLYTKPTDKYQHLHYSSCHPLHTKKSIPFSPALRLRRICSTDGTLNTRLTELKTYLLKRRSKRNSITKRRQRHGINYHRKTIFKYRLYLKG